MKQKNTGIFLGVIALIVIAGAVFASIKTTPPSARNNDMAPLEMPIAQTEATDITSDTAQVVADTPAPEMKPEMNKEVEAQKPGTYEEFAPEKIATAGAQGDVVLFFRASWCPTCRATDADIRANSTAIPAGLTILDVNYDNAATLKQKYGVTYQHTFVQVDKDGNLVKKWSGSPTLAALVAQVM